MFIANKMKKKEDHSNDKNRRQSMHLAKSIVPFTSKRDSIPEIQTNDVGTNWALKKNLFFEMKDDLHRIDSKHNNRTPNNVSENNINNWHSYNFKSDNQKVALIKQDSFYDNFMNKFNENESGNINSTPNINKSKHSHNHQPQQHKNKKRHHDHEPIKNIPFENSNSNINNYNYNNLNTNEATNSKNNDVFYSNDVQTYKPSAFYSNLSGPDFNFGANLTENNNNNNNGYTNNNPQQDHSPNIYGRGNYVKNNFTNNNLNNSNNIKSFQKSSNSLQIVLKSDKKDSSSKNLYMPLIDNKSENNKKSNQIQNVGNILKKVVKFEKQAESINKSANDIRVADRQASAKNEKKLNPIMQNLATKSVSKVLEEKKSRSNKLLKQLKTSKVLRGFIQLNQSSSEINTPEDFPSSPVVSKKKSKYVIIKESNEKVSTSVSKDENYFKNNRQQFKTMSNKKSRKGGSIIFTEEKPDEEASIFNRKAPPETTKPKSAGFIRKLFCCIPSGKSVIKLEKK